MLIETRDFGKLEINEKDIICFPKGIPAFENLTRYVLINYPHENIAPMWLQSVDDSSLCFIVFDPFLYVPDYEPFISHSDKGELKCENVDDLRYLVIAVIPEDMTQTTINLKSPLVINIKNNLAIQVVLEADYLIRFPLFAEKGV